MLNSGDSDFTQRNANNYGLTGWKQVQGEAQGEEAFLTKLLKDLSQGPRHAHVVKVEKSDIDVKEGESSFVVKRT
ncbi:hypothetical protein AJ79_06546 [Helicocarpus griseus UAMH5409]|uniref:Acylphosphatase-like domain-containing protein n=1 Tax=Helicocarpus griseus UAMH5409 TaxID=1447875 RepID=A0A2B7XBH9_9EURO|nr:hypothetical protein AJ79_06546 [Helicocarpus griseus UAMH5409]